MAYFTVFVRIKTLLWPSATKWWWFRYDNMATWFRAISTVIVPAYISECLLQIAMLYRTKRPRPMMKIRGRQTSFLALSFPPDRKKPSWMTRSSVLLKLKDFGGDTSFQSSFKAKCQSSNDSHGCIVQISMPQCTYLRFSALPWIKLKSKNLILH